MGSLRRRSRIATGMLLGLSAIAAGLVFAAPAGAASSSEFRFANKNTGGTKCIGIATSGYAGDWTCSHGDDQIWHNGAQYNSSGYYQLVNRDGRCLALQGGHDAENTRLIGYTCVSYASDQYWRFDGKYLFNYKATNDRNTPASVVGVSGGSQANGAPLVIWRWVDTANQQWSKVSP